MIIFQKIICLLGILNVEAKSNILINVADISWNSSCSAMTTRAIYRGYNFDCENVLSPNWINMESHLTGCHGYCNNPKLDIAFQKAYDIVEYCLSHTFMSADHKAKKVTVIYNKASNTQKQYALDLDSTNKDTECFLVRYTFGTDVKSMTFIPVQVTSSSNTGFSSIMIFSYQDDIIDKVESSNYYTNIANVKKGATCTAKSSASSYYFCKFALDHINGAFASKNEWASICNDQDCIGQYIKISFKIYGIPTIYCISNRYSTHYITKLKVKWSSGFVEIIELNKNKYQKCFKYTKQFIETGVNLEVVEIDGTTNVGLALVQVFVKDIEKREYGIHTDDHMSYILPLYIQNNFKAMTFSVYGSETVCGGLILLFYRNDILSFKIGLSNIVGSYVEMPLPHAVYRDELQEYVVCGQWNDFWMTSLDGVVKLGKGLIYNKNARIIAPIVSEGQSDKS